MGIGSIYKKYISKEITDLITDGHKIVIVGNKVYDFTDFNHPGNYNAFFNRIGKDVSQDYNFHNNNSKKKWEKYLIGYT